MSSRVQRGRKVPARRSPLPIFYAVLGIIVVLGIVLVAFAALGQQQSATAPTDITPGPVVNAPVGKTLEGFYYKGQPDAPVKVIEYGDFQCPACADFTRTLESTIDRTYVETGKVQMIYHDFPLPQHANAIPAAAAARCAGDQEKFWPMHGLLFSRQNEWKSSNSINTFLTAYATALGLNQQQFESCISTGTYTQAVRDAASSGAAAGINSTPTFVVNGTPVTADDLTAAIEAALNG